MNWIEQLYDIDKSGNKDLYSQNCEGIILEHIINSLELNPNHAIDIGGGDGKYLSNTRYLLESFTIGSVEILDKQFGHFVTKENCYYLIKDDEFDLLSIDIDGNDYWILDELFTWCHPKIIIAEFNSAYGDSRTIKYNPNHVWQGDSYYGFSFHAGVKLAEANGYKVIFQNNDMNMYMVREDLIKVPIPPVTFKLNNFFKMSDRTDWVFI